MPSEKLVGTRLDHIAVAAHKWADAWPTFIEALGGQWRSGGQALGFAPAQLEYENGLRVEILMPHQPEYDDFLVKFLHKHGPGYHHITFKVKDITKALPGLKELNIDPASTRLDNPWWKEIFISPRDGFSTVIQLAEAAGSWFRPAPEGVPEPPRGRKSELAWIALAPADYEKAVDFFGGLLGGEEGGEGKIDTGEGALSYRGFRFVGGGELRLLKAEGLEPGVHHIAFYTNNDELIEKGPLYVDSATKTRILLLPG